MYVYNYFNVQQRGVVAQFSVLGGTFQSSLSERMKYKKQTCFNGMEKWTKLLIRISKQQAKTPPSTFIWLGLGS